MNDDIQTAVLVCFFLFATNVAIIFASNFYSFTWRQLCSHFGTRREILLEPKENYLVIFSINAFDNLCSSHCFAQLRYSCSINILLQRKIVSFRWLFTMLTHTFVNDTICHTKDVNAVLVYQLMNPLQSWNEESKEHTMINIIFLRLESVIDQYRLWTMWWRNERKLLFCCLRQALPCLNRHKDMLLLLLQHCICFLLMTCDWFVTRVSSKNASMSIHCH